MLKLGAFLLLLVVIFVFGQLWFHLVESLLERIKRKFFRPNQQMTWHPLPPEQEEKKDP